MDQTNHKSDDIEGILIVDKPRGKTSFSLVAELRRALGVKKIGHAGTLDPFATGVMVMLIGRRYTKLSDSFLTCDKEYLAKVYLGQSTDTFDCDGKLIKESQAVPSLEEVIEELKNFQGEVEQTPPMFSAKKVNGKKLYELARQGQTIERKPVKVFLHTELVAYQYPILELRINCSKGTYIRSIANDLGQRLGCGAHLTELIRTRSGNYHLEDSLDGSLILLEGKKLQQRLLQSPV